MTLGEKLSKLRKEYNYTQEQLADILGVSRQSISKWESDIAFPETDKLIKMGKLFECSMDYLLNNEITEKNGINTNDAVPDLEKIKTAIKRQCRERKSNKIVFGMPLYHIGRNARGFFAIGLKARGVFAIGLRARGIVSLGLLSLGIISIGLLSIGLLSLGTLALGLMSVGSIALGLFAIGSISIGVVSIGALAVGCFSSGALAIGQYAAVGDHAHGMIALGETVANGSVYESVGLLAEADWARFHELLDTHTPSYLSWAKELYKLFSYR